MCFTRNVKGHDRVHSRLRGAGGSCQTKHFCGRSLVNKHVGHCRTRLHSAPLHYNLISNRRGISFYDHMMNHTQTGDLFGKNQGKVCRLWGSFLEKKTKKPKKTTTKKLLLKLIEVERANHFTALN